MENSLFKPFNPTTPYGMFGYVGFCCDLAIKRDDPDMARECWERGWMDGPTRMLIGTVQQECDRKAPKVAQVLRDLGECKVSPQPYA